LRVNFEKDSLDTYCDLMWIMEVDSCVYLRIILSVLAFKSLDKDTGEPFSKIFFWFKVEGFFIKNFLGVHYFTSGRIVVVSIVIFYFDFSKNVLMWNVIGMVENPFIKLSLKSSNKKFICWRINLSMQYSNVKMLCSNYELSLKWILYLIKEGITAEF